MGLSLSYKILRDHLLDGELTAGTEIGIRIDQTLTQDATGTMAYLQFEAMGIPRVRTELSVSYVDHNMLQSSFENADDHRFLQSAASKFGVYFSRPGNGICHQVHLERFSRPGKTLLGSDSHTPTCGGAGMIAIGAGGLDIAVAMGGGPFYMKTPKIRGIKLTGTLRPWVSAKDIILHVLSKLTCKGGINWIHEFYGPGVKSLSVPERSTVTNMGAELGATTSIFPSDKRTLEYFKLQQRAKDWAPAEPDDKPEYDDHMEIDLNKLEPLIAQPHSPDNVIEVKALAKQKIKVDQVCVGSCTNSSYYDLSVVAAVLKGKSVAGPVSMSVSPGSKQVFENVAASGALAQLITAGARILESACGPCIGMGQAPPSGGVSVRSFNRNFYGRSGTMDAKVYLASPETCAAAALTGFITDPRSLGPMPKIREPKKLHIDDSGILTPPKNGAGIELVRGPNIKPVPLKGALEGEISGVCGLKCGDGISTDHISPAGAKVLPLRSNIEAISEYTFTRVDETFPKRAKELRDKGVPIFIVGGDNYGQGSSREHAALSPMFLGVRVVIAKVINRIHRSNLINFGIVPLTFANAEDYTKVEQGHELAIDNLKAQLAAGATSLLMTNKTTGVQIPLVADLSPREAEVIFEGGLLNWTKANSDKMAAMAKKVAAKATPAAKPKKAAAKKPSATKKPATKKAAAKKSAPKKAAPKATAKKPVRKKAGV